MTKYFGRPICAVKPDGSMAGWFETQKQLGEYLGVKNVSVSLPLRDGSFYHGFKWMWLDEYRDKWMNGEDLSYEVPKVFNIYNGKGGIKKGMGKAFWDSLPEEVKIESKIKASKRLKERISKGETQIRCKRVKCVETGQEYFSIGECARELGVSNSTVFYAIKYGYATRKHKYHLVYI